jgi:hypothetical protein
MSFSKIATFLVLSGLFAPAFADDSPATSTPVETYTYQTKLDIHKVLAVTDISDHCGPIPVQMTYEDSKGQRHVIEYQAMGTACSNG